MLIPALPPSQVSCDPPWVTFLLIPGSFMVFHGFWLVSMVFQGSFMVFHGFWLVSMVFKVVSWFFMVFGWFPWVFMVFGWFPWFFMVPDWFVMVPGCFFMVFLQNVPASNCILARRSSLGPPPGRLRT